MNDKTLGAIGIGAGSAIIGGIVGYVAGSKSRKSKKRKKRRKHSSSRKRHSKRKIRRTPYTAGKRKDRSHRRIRYTKKGQPYIIMGNGRARFISKKGARMSRKRAGGRY